MNYKKIYDDLIDSCKTRSIDGYVENHHIIPVSLGGMDTYDNLVKLTPREHYVAHQLLIKLYPGNYKMIIAAQLLTVKNRNHQRNNKLYGWIKKLLSYAAIERRKSYTQVPWNKGRTGVYSPETIEKFRQSALGRVVNEHTKLKISNSMKLIRSGEDNPMYGKHHSLETRKKLSEIKSGENNPMYGKKHSEQGRKNISLGLKNQKKHECLHCGKLASAANITRWHNDNCKHKENSI